jgi:hypothetical protein
MAIVNILHDAAQEETNIKRRGRRFDGIKSDEMRIRG